MSEKEGGRGGKMGDARKTPSFNIIPFRLTHCINKFRRVLSSSVHTNTQSDQQAAPASIKEIYKEILLYEYI